MTDTSSPSERFSLVASFYGPGNIASWLCMVTSVVTTWCLNADYRRKDSISADLVVVLAVPGVAAGHAIYMLFFGSAKHESVRHLFTSSDPQIVQHAAAAEAALNVCETFSAIAILLVFISMFFGHLKRTLAVVAIGLLAFSTEAVVFVQTKGTRVSDSNLTRPFLFNFLEIMVSLVAFVMVWLLAFSLLMLWLRMRTIEQPHEQIELESSDPQLEMEVRAALRGQATDIDSAVIWENQRGAPEALRFAEADVEDVTAMRSLTMLGIFFLPLTFFASLVSMSTPLGVFGETSFIPSPNWADGMLFFVPRSATSITELDQMVAFCVGGITILFSLWDALKSQKREELRTRREIKQRAADRRRNWRQKRLNAGLLLLRQANDRLDQTEDETRRQELLDWRNALIVRLLRMVGS